MEGRSLRLVDEKGSVLWYRQYDEPFFDRLQRFLELLPDKDALIALDKVIEKLEAPKIRMATSISKELLKDGKMVGLLQEALTTLPMKQLREMHTKINSLRIKRKPDADCIIIGYGEKSCTLRL